MTTRITLTIVSDSDTPTGNDVSNAVRRALTTSNLKDTPITVPIVSKGVTVTTRPIKPRKPRHTQSEIRTFAIEQGLAKPGRGRLSKEAHEAWNKAVNKP